MPRRIEPTRPTRSTTNARSALRPIARFALIIKHLVTSSTTRSYLGRFTRIPLAARRTPAMGDAAAETRTTETNGIWSAYQAIQHICYGRDWKKDVITDATRFLTDIAERQASGGNVDHADLRRTPITRAVVRIRVPRGSPRSSTRSANRRFGVDQCHFRILGRLRPLVRSGEARVT